MGKRKRESAIRGMNYPSCARTDSRTRRITVSFVPLPLIAQIHVSGGGRTLSTTLIECKSCEYADRPAPTIL